MKFKRGDIIKYNILDKEYLAVVDGPHEILSNTYWIKSEGHALIVHESNLIALKKHSSEGVKHDGNKPPLDLIPKEFLEEVAKVLDFGKNKYGKGNWTKGLAYSRTISAAMRHLAAYNAGEDNDNETGISHIAHAACNLAFLIWHAQHRPDLDDRWAKPNVAGEGIVVNNDTIVDDSNTVDNPSGAV